MTEEKTDIDPKLIDQFKEVKQEQSDYTKLPQDKIDTLIELGLSIDEIKINVTLDNIDNTVEALNTIKSYALKHKWLKYPKNDLGNLDYSKEPTVQINILCDEFFKETHYFNTPDYLPGYLYNGQYWQRISNDKAQQSIIRSRLTSMLGNEYTSKIVGQALRIILDKSLNETRTNVFERNYNIVSFKNWAIDIDTLEVEPNKPNLYNLVGFNYDLELKNKPTVTLKFITDMLGDSTQFFCEYIGYMFKRKYEPFNTFVIVQGGAGTGKSTLFNLVQKLLGNENVSSASLHELANDRFMGYQLVDKSANIRSDISKSFIKESSFIKNLVGSDTITVQNKGGQPIEYNNYAKLLFSANETPAMASDVGIDRRGKIIPVVGKTHATDLKNDSFNLSKLDKELGTFAYYCIKAYSQAEKNNKWSLTPTIIEATKEWLSKGDDIKAWAEEHLIEATDYRPTAIKIYDLFNNDMLSDGYTSTISQRTFYNRLKELGYTVKKGKTINKEDDKPGENLKRIWNISYI